LKIAVTGGSGRVGCHIIPELADKGHEVTNVDVVDHPVPGVEFRATDLNQYDQALAAFQGVEAIVHMARSSSARQPETVFAVNVSTTWNVLQAAEELDVKKCVLASSVNAIGAVFSRELVPPDYFPIDENHPTRAEDAYSQSKWVGEQIADGFARRSNVQIASFRFHGIVNDDYLSSHRKNPISDAQTNAKDFWGYLHVADCARACRLALEGNWSGHETFFINAADTSLELSTQEALDKAFPGVPLVRDLPGFTSPLSIAKAKRLFGWVPQITWREALDLA
jgi:nucleoside-diphosphate-sugar epimerase